MKSKMYTLKNLNLMVRKLSADLRKQYPKRIYKQFKIKDFFVEITPGGLARLNVPYVVSKKSVQQSVNVVL